MQLTQIAMCDFRSFQGLHEIDLVPRTKYGSKRPIILFGGLNGAGKTSILTAVRLALYGKLVLGNRAGRKDYETFLSESIHKNGRTLLPADSAYVELQFEYGKLGERQQYRIQRSWTKRTASVEERLRIWRDGEPLRGVDREDAQAFLNELVPLGVSDPFFFDGEKIAELAEDRDGSALGDAIRRLVGIDLVERLRADLGIYLRRGLTKKADARERQKLQRLEEDYATAKMHAQSQRDQLNEQLDQLSLLDAAVNDRERALVQLGGRWAEGREAEQQKIHELTEDRHRHEGAIRELAAGLLPLALAKAALTDAMNSAEAEQRQAQEQVVGVELRRLAEELLPEAEGKLSKKGAAWLKTRMEAKLAEHACSDSEGTDTARYDCSPSELQQLRRTLTDLIPEVSGRAELARKALGATNDALDVAGVRLERAPDERSIESALETLREAQRARDELASEVAELRAQCKEAYRQALQHGRELKRAEDRLSEQAASDRPMAYARSMRSMLAEYGKRIAAAKVADLEQEFAAAFQRLARKEDLHVRTRIDPVSYQVSLLDEEGNVINRHQLSAGERQIYAIAMLEALAHTSGRRLPVIIDTPLGRLDSKHRSKLVNHYFPRASHQVLILSTDTEVDQSFYRDLSPEISHAYEIAYDPETRSSRLDEGYFWRDVPAFQEAG